MFQKYFSFDNRVLQIALIICSSRGRMEIIEDYSHANSSIISVRPLTEASSIVNKQVAICLPSSLALFVILSVRGHRERKKKQRHAGSRRLGINPIALRSSRVAEHGRIIIVNTEERKKNTSPLLICMQSLLV